MVRSLLGQWTSPMVLLALVVAATSLHVAATSLHGQTRQNTGNSQRGSQGQAGQRSQANQGQANQGQANQGQANQGQANRGGQVNPIRNDPVQRTAKNANPGQPPRGAARGAARTFAAPDWYPLTPKHQGYLEEILTYWEYHCKSIKHYECDFRHFVYGPTRENNGGRLASGNYPALEKHEGIIKYAEPDKAMYQTLKVRGYDPKQPKKYPEIELGRFGNHWICDGKAVYDFDYLEKQLFVDILPPEAQGQAIDRGPLPFLFRAKKDDLQRRFWMRVITPENVKDEYWLEVVPKFQTDSAYFQFAHIIIAEKDYLPQAIVLFDPAYSKGNPKKQTYIFENRRTNWSWKNAAKGLLLWQKQFYEPKLERGWKKVERQQQAPAPKGPDPRTASPRTASPRTARQTGGTGAPRRTVGGIR